LLLSLALLNGVKQVELHLKWEMLDFVVMYRVPLCPAGASLLADDDPVLLCRWDVERRHAVHCSGMYLSPLQRGSCYNLKCLW